MSIKTKIILLTSALLVLSISLCLFVSLHFLDQSFDHSSVHVFEQTEFAVQTLFEATQREMKNEARLMAEGPILTKFVEQGDIKSIEEVTHKYRDQLRFDYLDVFDEKALLLARSSQDKAFQDHKITKASYLAAVKDALSGKKFSTFVQFGDRIAILGIAPIGFSGDPSGVIVVGTFLNDEFAAQLKQLTSADIALATVDQKIIASSLESNQRDILAKVLAEKHFKFGEKKIFEEHIFNDTLLKDHKENIIGQLVIYLSLEDMNNTTRKIVQSVLALGMLIIFLSLILSFLTAQALTKKMIEVIEATQRIANGHLHIQVPVNSKDEIGDLARSVNWMSEKIVSLLAQEKVKAALEKELETANTVQMTFFSEAIASSPPFFLASFYTPASQCGGDWWGHYRLAEGVELLLIGDATGHGVPAALVTAMAYSTSDIYARILTQGQLEPIKPSSILSELNRMLFECLSGKLCMSFFAAILDSRKGTLTYANGGHCFPFLIPQNPADERVKTHSLHHLPAVPLNYREKSSASIVGIVSESIFSDDEIPLKQGDRIVFYTDGLTEARSKDGRPWGTRNLLKSITQHQHRSAAELCTSVIDDLKAFHQKETYEDDVTLVVLEYMP